FIQGMSLRRFRNLKDAAQSLNVLAGQSSPLMTLVKIIAEHTDFKQELTQAQFAEKPSPFKATPPLVQVMQDFQSIQRLMLVQDGTVTPPITPYFDALAELGDAMQKIAAASEGGATAFAQEFLSGKNNALSRGMESIERRMGNRDSLLRPLFEQPLKYSWDVILVEAQAHLNKLWANAVYAPFVETLATKYPFDPQGREDASRTEAGDFFKPINGTFWSFFDKHLAGFVDHQSGPTKGRPGFEGIRVSEDFRAALARADFLSKNLVATERQTQPISLRLQPEPPQNAPNIDTIELYYDGRAYQYKMGQRPIWTLTWPVANQKIQIMAKTQNRPVAIKVFAGHWALFRMLSAARMEQHTLYWNFEGMKTNIGFTVVEMSSTLLPMIKNLQSFHCPGKLD
ncbi:MAG: type VI secretion IcmF C-terminal domain-containing protein, partial [bacterium]